MQFLPETSEALSCPQCVFKDCTTQHPHSHLLPSPRFCTQILMICCLREDLTIRIVAIWSPLLECEYCSTGVSSKRKNVFFSNESLSHTLQHSATMVITSLSGLSWERNKASMDENSLRTGRRAVRQERNSKEPQSMDNRVTKLPKYSTLPSS